MAGPQAQSPSLEETFERTSTGIVRTFLAAGVVYTSEVDSDVLTEDARGDWWRSFLAGVTPRVRDLRGQIRSVDLFCGPGGLATGFGQAATELGYQFVSEAAVDED